MTVFTNSFHSILVIISDIDYLKVVLSIIDNHRFYNKNTDLFVLSLINFLSHFLSFASQPTIRICF